MTPRDSRYRSPRAIARGHGAAHTGTGAFLWERLTAAALLPLGAWLLVELVCLSAGGMDLAAARAWLGQPLRAGLVLAFFLIAMANAYLCCRVLIEDYVHRPAHSLLALAGLLVYTVGLGFVVTLAVLYTLFRS